MSDILDTSKAYGWYDPSDGTLKHVTFIMDHVHPDGTEQIEIEPETAKAILLGVSRLSEYKILTNTAGAVELKYQPITVTEYFSKFWSLEELPVEEEPFMKIFGDARDFESPVRVFVTDDGLEIMVVSLAMIGKVYVTRKNDPNYLVRTVDMAEAIKQYQLGPIPVLIEDADEYSVYVRYYNAA